MSRLRELDLGLPTPNGSALELKAHMGVDPDLLILCTSSRTKIDRSTCWGSSIAYGDRARSVDSCPRQGTVKCLAVSSLFHRRKTHFILSVPPFRSTSSTHVSQGSCPLPDGSICPPCLVPSQDSASIQLLASDMGQMRRRALTRPTCSCWVVPSVWHAKASLCCP